MELAWRMVRGGGKRSDPGSWRSDASYGFGLFAVGFAVAWYQKSGILLWIVEPVLRVWPNGSLPYYLPLPTPSGLFLAYVCIATASGFVAALPFIARLFCGMWPSVRARLGGFVFVFGSYVGAGIGLLLAQSVVFRPVAAWLAERALADANRAGESPLRATLTVADFVMPAVAVAMSLVLLFEIGVVVATLRTRAHSPKHRT